MRLSRAAIWWALSAIVINRMSVARVVAELAVSWNTVIIEAGSQLINDPAWYDNVRVIGDG